MPYLNINVELGILISGGQIHGGGNGNVGLASTSCGINNPSIMVAIAAMARVNPTITIFGCTTTVPKILDIIFFGFIYICIHRQDNYILVKSIYDF